MKNILEHPRTSYIYYINNVNINIYNLDKRKEKLLQPLESRPVGPLVPVARQMDTHLYDLPYLTWLSTQYGPSPFSN